MFTAAAARSSPDFDHLGNVASYPELLAAGFDADRVAAQLRARRWQRCGLAVVLGNGPEFSAQQRHRIALINCGPRSVLTSFTAAEQWGLRGWERPEVHVLAPAGTTRPPLRDLRLHRTGDWRQVDLAAPRRLHRLAPALVVAAGSFGSPRPGCGLLAAAVQQRLLTASELTAALAAAPRVRHRAALRGAVGDIAQGAQALSEIDFGRLCRRFGLPRPTRQAIRVEPSGRRRYLDAEWRRSDGRVVAAEVDGALHLNPQRWVEDQLRQNEIVLGGTLVLRFPSVVVRHQPELVAAQLRRALCGS